MELLRKPFGLSFTPAQPADEKNDIPIGAFDGDELAGSCVLTAHNDQNIQLRQMAVSEYQQEKAWKKGHCV